LTIRNSNVTSNKRLEVRGWRLGSYARALTSNCDLSLHVMFHAHCVCVVGKNYRLQDIQLSKIPPSLLGSFGETGSVNLSIQLATGKLSRACLAVAPNYYIGAKAGGEYRARTGDLLVANQALSQLS
jgi:hypothetical protein